MQDHWKYVDQQQHGKTNTWSEPGLSEENREPGSNRPQSEEQVRSVKKIRKSRKAVKDFLGGDYLTREWVTGNIPFLFYVAILTMIYIGNTYYTEKKYKDIERTKNELKELRYRYITTKSTLMYQCRQSEISKHAIEFGLKETIFPPYKILYSGNTLSAKQE